LPGFRARAQVGPLLGAHAPPPAEALDHDRPPQHELLAGLVAERDRPAAQLVEALERVDEMTVERVAPQLAVRHDVDPGVLLQPDRLFHGPVLDRLERHGVELAGLGTPPGDRQPARTEQAADDLTAGLGEVGGSGRAAGDAPAAHRSITSLCRLKTGFHSVCSAWLPRGVPAPGGRA
jgi:hypothetical protein